MQRDRLYIALLSIMLPIAGMHSACAADTTASQTQTIVADNGEKTLDLSWNVAADARIEISNVRGTVIVTGQDQPQVKLTGSLGSGSKLEVSGDAQHLTLRADGEKSGWFSGNGPNSDSDLTVIVPRGVSLKVGVVSADANVSAVSGKSIDVSSVSGNLTVTSDAPQIDINNVSGDVVFAASKPNAASRAHLQTVSGDIKASKLGGRVKLETVSGDILMETGEVQELETGTVSGDARIKATPAAHARVALESMSGDISVQLPSALSAHVEAQTFSGSIGSDFGKVQEKERGPGSSLDAHIGDGDAQIKAQSFSGDIELRKQGG
jgi:DUF4097 and DUF4098 domain-containing protein YvlB